MGLHPLAVVFHATSGRAPRYWVKCWVECLPLCLQVTKLLFDHVWGSWGTLLNETLGQLPAALQGAQGQAPPAALLQAFERWMLLLKV